MDEVVFFDSHVEVGVYYNPCLNLFMNEDLVITAIVDLQEDMSVVKEKLKKLDEIDGKVNTIMNGQDTMIKLLQDVRQEQVFGSERVKRLETDVKTVKLKLQIA